MRALLAAVPLPVWTRLRERWLLRRQGRSEIAAQIELLRGQVEAMSDLAQEVGSIATRTETMLEAQEVILRLTAPKRLSWRFRGVLVAFVVLTLVNIASATRLLNVVEDSMSSASSSTDEARATEYLAYTLMLDSANLPTDASIGAIEGAGEMLKRAGDLRRDASAASAHASNVRSWVLVQGTVMAAMLGGLFSWLITAFFERARVSVLDVPDTKRTRRFGRRGASSADNS